MGLDMYLNGEKFLWTHHETPEKNVVEDGYRVRSRILELGYWRKHPDLHGYIVQTFANGVDECQEISLGLKSLEQILAAVKANALPPTSGFFFGTSDKSRKKETVEILTRAIKWLKDGENDDHVSRSVTYRASW